jgi:chromosome partitioning protein
MQGTSTLLETIEKVRNNFNPDLELLGVVLNAYDDRPTIFREIREELENFFRTKLFKTNISRSIKFEEAIAEMKGITELEGDFKVKSEVEELTKEVLFKLEGAKDDKEA